MLTRIYLCLFIFLLTISLYSQSRFNAGASFNIGFPAASFSDLAKTGIGGSAIGEFAFSEQCIDNSFGILSEFSG